MANPMTITFDVENQILSRTDTNRIVEKSKNYLVATFNFSSDWDDTQKAAIIENGGMRFKVYLENNECDIPNRAVSHDGFTITIVGEDEEKNITITTSDLFIAVQKNNASDVDEGKIYIHVCEFDGVSLVGDDVSIRLEFYSTHSNPLSFSQICDLIENEHLQIHAPIGYDEAGGLGFAVGGSATNIRDGYLWAVFSKGVENSDMTEEYEFTFSKESASLYKYVINEFGTNKNVYFEEQ